jgi:hypothetical protein
MPAWPADLPLYPNNGNAKETPPHILVQDENNEGPANASRKMGVRKLTLPYRFMPLDDGRVQIDIFDEWLDQEVAGGSLPYDFFWPPAPRNTQSVQARIVTIPQYEDQGGGVWDVTLEVIILP